MTPRPYLSYSQMILVEASPQAYIDQYIHGKKRGTNRGMALGKEIAEAMEHESDTGDISKDLIISKLPRYAIRDKEIRMTLELGKNSVPLLIKPDSIEKDYSAFFEYKTGDERYEWTLAKVRKDTQMLFYATGVSILTDKIPKAALVWAPTTKDEYGRPSLTGEIRTFAYECTYADILKMKARMMIAWKIIKKITENELL